MPVAVRSQQGTRNALLLLHAELGAKKKAHEELQAALLQQMAIKEEQKRQQKEKDLAYLRHQQVGQGHACMQEGAHALHACKGGGTCTAGNPQASLPRLVS